MILTGTDAWNLCVMDKRFLILEGATGRVKEEHALPSEEAHDCIIIANLSGKDRPEDIILKDRYFHMWALNRQFELLWTHEGNLGHFPWCSDVNGDGYDEVMAGYDLLDHNGRVLWSCHDLEDHAGLSLGRRCERRRQAGNRRGRKRDLSVQRGWGGAVAV